MGINKKKLLKIVLFTAITLMIAGIFSGCRSTKNKEQQEAYRQYGIACLRSGDYEEAVKAFQNALDQSIGGVGATEIDICLYKAKALYLKGDFDAAEEVYTALIDYKGYTEGYFQRGCFYFATGNSEKGFADLKVAMDQEPDNYDIYIGTYELLTKYGYGEDPYQYLKKALEIKGDDAEALMQKGRINLLLEDYDTAIDNLNKAVDKGNAQANFYLAQVYAQKGDDTLSNSYFEEYTKSGVASASDLSSMAETLMSKGDYESAKNYFEAALDMNDVTDTKLIRKNLIICYENISDFKKAKSLLESYLKDYPDDEEALNEKVFLKTR